MNTHRGFWEKLKNFIFDPHHMPDTCARYKTALGIIALSHFLIMVHFMKLKHTTAFVFLEDKMTQSFN